MTDNKIVETAEIDIESIKSLQNELSALDTNWVSRMSSKITKHLQAEGSDEICSNTKIYGIYTGGVKNNRWRALFIIYGNELKQEMLELQQKAKSLLS